MRNKGETRSSAGKAEGVMVKKNLRRREESFFFLEYAALAGQMYSQMGSCTFS